MLLVKQQQEQVEGARQVVAVEAPRVDSEPARSGVEDRLPPGKHPLEPGKEVDVLVPQVLGEKRLCPKRIYAASRRGGTEHGDRKQEPQQPRDEALIQTMTQ